MFCRRFILKFHKHTNDLYLDAHEFGDLSWYHLLIGIAVSKLAGTARAPGQDCTRVSQGCRVVLPTLNAPDHVSGEEGH